MVLQVDGGEARVAPVKAIALAVSLDKAVLGHPVELIGQFHRVVLELGEHGFPALEHLTGDRAAHR
ncbi:unannotated protein [freshwater metagenome]|uniref:Unannotated protein n=1 Tax=freshwater metagenome TaxID=449393 RepID=A0A6J7QTA4_9ZZZZ